ncbi:MAG: DUF4391 domain-containing protein [Opitutales bacterium]
MFAYPPQTEVNRVLPKTKIYAHGKASRSLQNRIAKEVEKIIWRHKLAPETLNLGTSGPLREIQVFEVRLKEDEVHEDVLKAIDRTIRHPIAFQIKTDDRVRYAMAHKRPSEADASKWVTEEYFWTDWKKSTPSLQPLPAITTLMALYETMLSQHLPVPPREGESLTQCVERMHLVKRKEREAAKLESKIAKEKQFNRKVDLNKALREITREVESLT